MLYGSEAWCLKEGVIGIFRRTERSMERAMCGVQLKDSKRSTDFMFLSGLRESMDQLAMANSAGWYGHVLRREDGHFLRMALDFEVEGQRMERRPKMAWKKQVEEKCVQIGLRMEDALCRSMWSVGVNQIAARLR